MKQILSRDASGERDIETVRQSADASGEPCTKPATRARGRRADGVGPEVEANLREADRLIEAGGRAGRELVALPSTFRSWAWTSATR